MIEVSKKIIVYLIFTAIALALGITTLVLAIVYEYIGFSSASVFALTTSSCSDAYLTIKYSSSFTDLRISAGFVGICLGLLLSLVGFVWILMTLVSFKSYRQMNPNEEDTMDVSIPIQVLSPGKFYGLWFVMAFALLAVSVAFSHFVSFFIDATTNTIGCAFAFSEMELILLAAISGVQMVFLLLNVFAMLSLNDNLVRDVEQEAVKEKYVEMMNVTQQPQAVNNQVNSNNNYNQNEENDQNLRKVSAPEKKMVNQDQNEVDENNINVNIIEVPPVYSNENVEKSDAKESYKDYRERQMRNSRFNKELQEGSDWQQRSPIGSLYNFSVNGKQSRIEASSRRRNIFDDGNTNVDPSRRPERDQQAFNQNIYQNQAGEDDNKGKLVFHRNIRKNRSPRDQNPLDNEGQTPSKFTSKFVQEESHYLRNNLRPSVLGGGNVQESSPGRGSSSARRKIFEQTHKTFQRSVVNRQLSPGQSRSNASNANSKSREGVLTNFIRGKFNE